jgi:hypothetical protein
VELNRTAIFCSLEIGMQFDRMNRYDDSVGFRLRNQNQIECIQNAGKILNWRNLLGGFAGSARKRTTRKAPGDHLAGIGNVFKLAYRDDNTTHVHVISVSTARYRPHSPDSDQSAVTTIHRVAFSAWQLRHQANRTATRELDTGDFSVVESQLRRLLRLP